MAENEGLQKDTSALDSLLERVCTEHPDLEPRLRKRFGFLRSAGMTGVQEEAVPWSTAEPTRS